MYRSVCCAVALFMAAVPASAQDAELSKLREALRQLQQQVQQLEKRLQEAEAKSARTEAAPLGMREVGSLEPKPGLPPSGAHLSELVQRLKRTPANGVLRAAYNDPRPSEWLAGQAGIPALMLPFTVGGTDGAKDLFSLYEDTLSRLLSLTK